VEKEVGKSRVERTERHLNDQFNVAAVKSRLCMDVPRLILLVEIGNLNLFRTFDFDK
jgi:hypothetical protein